jgi:hypothetical protein
VHLFRPSLGFLTEAQPRLKTGEDKRRFLAERTVIFLGTARTTKQKASLEKLQIYFVSTIFK